MPRILVVEDEPKLADLLADYLKAEHYQVDILTNGLEVGPHVRESPPDLLLLDLMLPGKNGLAVCSEIRTFSFVPIIMITARVEEIDRLLGLELGADDYICKPFSPREVVARVKALLRRSTQGTMSLSRPDQPAASVASTASGHDAGTRPVVHSGPDAPSPAGRKFRTIGAFPAMAQPDQADPPKSRLSRMQTPDNRSVVVDEETHQARCNGQPLDLTPAEFRLLRQFTSSPGKVFSRDALLTFLYDDHRVVTDRTIDTHIKNLRRKLQQVDPTVDRIVSIYGVGYRFEQA